MTAILGIVNVTRDSFSDGGRYFGADAAIEHAKALIQAGATMVDLGAESTHPDAEQVSATEEIKRLTPVIEALVDSGIAVSVDSWKTAVMRHAIDLGVRMINDVNGLRDPAAVEVVAAAEVDVVVMHSCAAGARADRAAHAPDAIVDHILVELGARLDQLEARGLPRQRVIVDPGMGFFLSPNPAPSLMMLRSLERLAELGCRVLVGVSRKSFIGEVLDRKVDERAAGSLAAEIWAAQHGADWIRSHDVRALADALRMLAAIAAAGR